MKRFKIIEDGVLKYQIEGESIEAIYKGREIPKVWADAKPEVEDITEELEELKRKTSAEDAMKHLFFDYTNDISYPALKKGIREALAKGLTELEDIKKFVLGELVVDQEPVKEGEIKDV